MGMDIFDILPIVQQYITVKAVPLAIIITQGVKYFLPTPLAADTKMAVVPGTLSTRLLPFLPVTVGVLYCTLVEPTSTIMENVIRGIFTGAIAAYGYRTAKVSFFGN